MKSEVSVLEGARIFPLLATLTLGIIIWFIPVPSGLKVEAWHLFAIFLSTIVGIILKVLPIGAVAIIGIAVVAITGVLDPNSTKGAVKLALSGFSNHVIWLIVLAFFIARGFIKTGLGSRIAYIFVRAFGKKTLGLSYSLLGADLILAPAVPSNTARGGGIIYPILRSLSESFGSLPDGKTNRKIGSFLILSAFQGNIITSAMFMTAMAANPLAVKLAGDLGVEITWTGWALAALVPGIIALVVIPYFIYKIFPPQIKETLNAPKIANEKLKEMGSIKIQEYIMLATFVMLLVMWIFGKSLGINGTAAALTGLGILLVTGVLTWGDVKKETGAWDTLVWFSALVMMATYLNKLGFISWFSGNVQGVVGDMSWYIAFPVLITVYVYVHYFFASATAQVAAMYAAFLSLGIAVGVPPMLMALSLAFMSNIYATMTHYGTGPAPVFFGSGYVELKDWWRIGFYISVIQMFIWLGIGGVWWKVLGIW